MTVPTNHVARRILLVDDNVAIHDDFRKVLAPPRPADTVLDDLELALFDDVPATRSQLDFDLVSAYQGKDAHALVCAALVEGRPFAVAFVDMRMPPGWDGLETIEHLWRADPHLQIVICSAYSDHSWSELRARLGDRDALLILKKPFDTIEVVQIAHALTSKWLLARENREHLEVLERTVAERTAELETTNSRLEAELLHRDRMEAELRLAHRLEAMGQLASGVAHEINTPIQYVSVNIELLRTSAGELLQLCTAIRDAAAAPGRAGELASQIQALIAEVDLPHLAEVVPEGIEAIHHGVERVTSVVRAMKEMAHPGAQEAVAADLNRALRNALELTASQYRYIAELTSDLPDLPPVRCFLSELNQVFVNLIVNAAHAIEDSGPRRGKLGVRTRVDGADVVVSISDTGCGIAEAHRDQIFNMTFTTKVVGRGTGQGLAITRSIVVDRHGGSLTFDSTVGEGTTFHVRLPIAGPPASAESA